MESSSITDSWIHTDHVQGTESKLWYVNNKCFLFQKIHFVGKCPVEFFLDHKEDVKECIRIAKTFIQTCEDIVNTAEDNPPKHEEPRRSDYTEPPRPRNTNSSSSRPTYVNPNPQFVSSSSSSGAIGRSYSSSSGSLSFSGGRTSSSSGGGGGFLALKWWNEV